MKKNNFKMRCIKVDKASNGLYTEGKVYECINGTFIADDGIKLWNNFNTFEDFQRWSKSEWELVKDDVETNKTITINISDYKSTLIDSNGVELCIRRYCATDKHDEKFVINELTKRYINKLDRIEKEKNSIKVGDVVKIVNYGYRYPAYKDFIIENSEELQKQMSIKEFAKLILNFNKTEIVWDYTYKVDLIKEHSASTDIQLAIVSSSNYTFIIDINGLRKVNN